MLVYFTASIVGKKYHVHQYQQIIKIINKMGHQSISDHIMYTSANEINLESKQKRIEFHEKLESWIDKCDCMIVEVSFPSISVGYEIFLGLEKRKPILLLCTSDNFPSLLAHHKDDRLVCEKYCTATLEEIIDNFLNYANDIEERRFIFYINSTISSYLDKLSKKHRVPKSVVLRRIITKHMDDNSKK